MASFGKPRVLGRIVLLFLMIVALVIGGLVWFDYIGLIDAKALLGPAYRAIGIPARKAAPVSVGSPSLLEDERIGKRLEALQARSDELDERESQASKKDAEIGQKAQELEERGKALDDKEKSFNDKVKQYENRKVNVEQNAQYLKGMPPEQAVEILKAMDDQTVIDILRSVEEQAKAAGEDSIVSFWLSKMPSERSAAIQRKMTIKPSGLD
jgi:flagellar protein FlbB